LHQLEEAIVGSYFMGADIQGWRLAALQLSAEGRELKIDLDDSFHTPWRRAHWSEARFDW
jgi:hypothetical protein